jgi:hypothetical protein
MPSRAAVTRASTRGTLQGGTHTSTRALVTVSLALFVLLLLHDLDHVVRQQEPTSGPGGVPLYAWAVSVVGYVGVLAAAWLAVRGDRRAAPLTQLLGFGFAAGFLLAHALPFGPGSYWVYKPGAISWALVIAPMIVGVAAIVVGHRAARAPA